MKRGEESLNEDIGADNSPNNPKAWALNLCG